MFQPQSVTTMLNYVYPGWITEHAYKQESKKKATSKHSKTHTGTFLVF